MVGSKFFFILACLVLESTADKCVKFSFKNAYACPMHYFDDGGFSVSISDLKEVTITCRKLQRFRMDLLPNITIPEIKLLLVRDCPLPEPGFKNILDAFSTKFIREIEYEYRQPKDQNVTKNHFKNLQNLKYLTLANNEYKDLDEDLFKNTHNLIGIELMENELRSLKPNLFKNLTNLEFLDISLNKLHNLHVDPFMPLKKLEVLRLFRNNLTNVDNLFRGLHNLKQLELDENHIENISEIVFQDLQNLQLLNLGRNQLRSIPSGFFRSNSQLQVIKLFDNPHFRLDDYMFSNFSSLVAIDLTMCELMEIPEHIFENSIEIRHILLDRNQIEKLPDKIFATLLNLEEIGLANNKIKTIENLFTSLTKLKRLSLYNNNIETIDETTFQDLISLEVLNLQNNVIKNIHPNCFVHNVLLQEIDLSDNLYSGGDPIFKELTELEEINLSNNNISQVETVTLLNKHKLKSVNLRYNSIKYISLVSLQGVSNFDIFLEDNEITVVDFTNVELVSGNHTSVIYLGNNPLHCDCHNYELAKYITKQQNISEQVKKLFTIPSEELICDTPLEVLNVRLRDIPVSFLHCSFEHLSGNATGCPKECSCFWKPSNQSVFIDCANRNLTIFPDIEATFFSVEFKEIEVDLTNNRLLTMNVTSYSKVTKMYLSHNKLVTIAAIPKYLQVLHLDHNELTSLSSKILTQLNTSSLINLSLSNNSWYCVCGTEQLASFIRQNSKKIDFQNVYCHNSTTRLIDLTSKDLCQDFIHISITVTISVFLLLSLTTAFYYRHQQQIKVWLYARNWCLWWVTEEDLDKDKPFDAFISYCHQDENFVANFLVPGLEQGPEPFKLCLHYREWPPGELISTHICNSVENSKRTIIVLSKHFVGSSWGKAEFRQAHSKEMVDRRARVIVILCGEVNTDILDDDMKAYLQTNTYLDWKDPYFWDKLRYAMPHRRR